MSAMWPHEDHIGGYMIRTAVGKVGAKDRAALEQKRAFENGCSGLVFCSAFKSAHVWAACAGLNVSSF